MKVFVVVCCLGLRNSEGPGGLYRLPVMNDSLKETIAMYLMQEKCLNDRINKTFGSQYKLKTT